MPSPFQPFLPGNITHLNKLSLSLKCHPCPKQLGSHLQGWWWQCLGTLESQGPLQNEGCSLLSLHGQKGAVADPGNPSCCYCHSCRSCGSAMMKPHEQISSKSSVTDYGKGCFHPRILRICTRNAINKTLQCLLVMQLLEYRFMHTYL
jgi:hypothetical protein